MREAFITGGNEPQSIQEEAAAPLVRIENTPRFVGPARDPSYALRLQEFARNPAVMLELSSRCNFFCDYCRSPISDRQKSTMSRELFNHVLPQLSGLTQRRLRFHIDGEPMLHPQFLELALDANRAGYRLAIASNASALRNEYLPIAMDLFVHLSTSAQEHARRSKLDFHQYVQKILRYVAGWMQGGSPQNLEFKVFFNGCESMDSDLLQSRRAFAASFASELGIDSESCWQPPDWRPPLLYRNRAGYDLTIRFQQTTEGGLYPNISAFSFPGDLPRDWGFCDSAWKILAIHSDGAIGYCCVDLTGKTIFTEPQEIWDKPLAWIWQHHPRLVEARRQYLNGQITLPICQQCLEICSHRESYCFTEIFPGNGRE
jgi:organic radical activating enzyme